MDEYESGDRVPDMTSALVKVVADVPNGVVLFTPGRTHPGLVVQGDTLANLHFLARKLGEALAAGADCEAKDLAGQIEDELAMRLDHYERSVKALGLPLPYPAGSAPTCARPVRRP